MRGNRRRNKVRHTATALCMPTDSISSHAAGNARKPFVSVLPFSAIAIGSFDFAQDDGREENARGTKCAISLQPYARPPTPPPLPFRHPERSPRIHPQ